MAQVLEVSRSNYYKTLNKPNDKLSKYDPKIVDAVDSIWKSSKKTYGLIRIQKKVKEIDKSYGSRRIRNIMRLKGIEGKRDRKYRVVTTDSKHNSRIAPDLVKRKFEPSEKDKIWVSDVTFIPSSQGWLYLCIIMDLYSRRIVSWELSTNNNSELVKSALNKAILLRNPNINLIFHTDRGSNYCSNEVRKLLINNRIRRSNSRKGNCWDNAVAESFFSTFKRELEYFVFYDIKDARREISEHIEIFYNRQRIHSKLGYKSPYLYEEINAKKVSPKT